MILIKFDFFVLTLNSVYQANEGFSLATIKTFQISFY